MWLGTESLTVEYGGEPLSRYEVAYSPGSGHLRQVGRPKLFETSHRWGHPQPRLFPLDEAGWLKALRLGDYAQRRPRRPEMLQQALFAYHAARG